jgi:hypothetical protein
VPTSLAQPNPAYATVVPAAVLGQGWHILSRRCWTDNEGYQLKCLLRCNSNPVKLAIMRLESSALVLHVGISRISLTSARILLNSPKAGAD